jgi:DNA-binding GntR family transcriptional regulator
MNPWLYDLARRLNLMRTAAELQSALDEVEDFYDAVPEADQEAAERLMAAIRQRLHELDADTR